MELEELENCLRDGENYKRVVINKNTFTFTKHKTGKLCQR